MHGETKTRLICAVLAATAALLPRPALAQSANPPLSNVAFGNVTSLSLDLRRAQNTCSFAGVFPITYTVTATGSGTGNAFTVTNGTSTVSYEVQWAQTANAASGSNLTANVALTNQSGGGIVTGLTCFLGLTNATLIVIVRAGQLQQATTGSYSGTLSVVLAVQ